MSGAGARRRVGELATRSEVAVALVVAGIGLVGRAYARAGAPPLGWNDSADYVEAARMGLWSPERLVGSRPVLMPLVLTAAAQDQGRFTVWQAVLASAAWGVLAATTWWALRHRVARVAAVVAIAALSLSWSISMWDQQILTESLALSVLALVSAAGLAFARRRRPATAVALVLSCGLLLVARDSTAIPVATVGLGLVAMGARRGAPDRRVLVLTGAYLLAFTFLLAGTARVGERNLQPLEHVYAVRVFPYPERVEWFADHGMPQAEGIAAIPEATDPVLELAPFTPIPRIERWQPWRDWLEAEGQAALARFALEHPTYLLTEPFRSPERVFNNAGGLDGYRPLDQRAIPGADLLGSPSTPVVAIVAIAAGFVVALLGERRRPAAIVGAVLAITSIPHALGVWHLDGMESARHLLVPVVQLRIGTVLLVAAALDGVIAARGTAPSRPARSPDRQPAPTPRRA
jgi:hypothetical protein